MYKGRAKLSFLKQNSILLLSIAVILFFTGHPLLAIVKNSFFSDGTFSISAYADVFSSVSTYKALLNTLLVAFGVLLLAGAIGGSLAFLVEKTAFRFKKLVRFLVSLEFCIPSYILSVSWIQITSRGGYLHRLIKLFDPSYSYAFSPYSLAAVIAVLSVHLYPLVFFGISNALRRSDGVLEDAGRTAGATPFKVLKSISLPLVMPSFLSTGLLIFSRAMANFGVAAQLALPVGSEVLTTRIYKAISELNIQSLSVLSLLLIAISYTFYFFDGEMDQTPRFLRKWQRAYFRAGAYGFGQKNQLYLPCCIRVLFNRADLSARHAGALLIYEKMGLRCQHREHDSEQL